MSTFQSLIDLFNVSVVSPVIRLHRVSGFSDVPPEREILINLTCVSSSLRLYSESDVPRHEQKCGEGLWKLEVYCLALVLFNLFFFFVDVVIDSTPA